MYVYIYNVYYIYNIWCVSVFYQMCKKMQLLKNVIYYI